MKLDMADTNKQYDEVVAQCRDLFVLKMSDYGPSWRIEQPTTSVRIEGVQHEFSTVPGMKEDVAELILNIKLLSAKLYTEQPKTITDQIFINAKRIRTIMLNGEAKVDDDIYSEFIGIVNYGVIGLIQLEHGFSDTIDMSSEQAVELYDKYIAETKNLMMAKNTDYGEAWRDMRTSSYVDFILTKVQRTKSIENNAGKTLVSEGIAANYQDMINYAVFALIRHNEGSEM